MFLKTVLVFSFQKRSCNSRNNKFQDKFKLHYTMNNFGLIYLKERKVAKPCVLFINV